MSKRSPKVYHVFFLAIRSNYSCIKSFIVKISPSNYNQEDFKTIYLIENQSTFIDMRKNNKGQRILKQKGSNYKCRDPFPNEEDIST